jgi:hypothetical protein
MSTLRVTTITNPSGGQPTIDGLAKAWVNFNGTGTVAIRASLNVSSITDNGTGDYTVNFTTAFSDANYAVAGGAAYSSDPASGASAARYVSISTQAAPTTTTCRFISAYANGGKDDCTIVNVSVFR